MTIFALWVRFFDGDFHPSPMQIGLHLTEEGARRAAAEHATNHPTWNPYAYSNGGVPNPGTVATCPIDELDNTCEASDSVYLITPMEVKP